MQDLTQEQAIGLLALDLKEVFDGREVDPEVTVEAGAVRPREQAAEGRRRNSRSAEETPAAMFGTSSSSGTARKGLEERLWNVVSVHLAGSRGPALQVRRSPPWSGGPPDGWPQVPE